MILWFGNPPVKATGIPTAFAMDRGGLGGTASTHPSQDGLPICGEALRRRRRSASNDHNRITPLANEDLGPYDTEIDFRWRQGCC